MFPPLDANETWTTMRKANFQNDANRQINSKPANDLLYMGAFWSRERKSDPETTILTRCCSISHSI